MNKFRLKKFVFEFLDMRFKKMVILRDIYDMSDVRIERFYCKSAAPIIEYRKFHSDKKVNSKVNHFVENDLRNYFNLSNTEIAMYVLEWCRDKTCKY